MLYRCPHSHSIDLCAAPLVNYELVSLQLLVGFPDYACTALLDFHHLVKDQRFGGFLDHKSKVVDHQSF